MGIGLGFHRADPATLQLVIFSDASFSANKQVCSQLGFVIVLLDASGRASIVSFGSRKRKGVVHSTLGAEIFAFPDAMKEALPLCHEIDLYFGRRSRCAP